MDKESIISAPLARQAGELEIVIDDMPLFSDQTNLIATAIYPRIGSGLVVMGSHIPQGAYVIIPGAVQMTTLRNVFISDVR